MADAVAFQENFYIDIAANHPEIQATYRMKSSGLAEDFLSIAWVTEIVPPGVV